jgi:hypothetical protein
LDGIISHVVQVAGKKNLVPYVKFTSDLFQIEVLNLYTPATSKLTLILHVSMELFTAPTSMPAYTWVKLSFARGGK